MPDERVVDIGLLEDAVGAMAEPFGNGSPRRRPNSSRGPATGSARGCECPCRNGGPHRLLCKGHGAHLVGVSEEVVHDDDAGRTARELRRDGDDLVALEDVLGDPHRQSDFAVLDEIGGPTFALADGAHDTLAAGEVDEVADSKRHTGIIANFSSRLALGTDGPLS